MHSEHATKTSDDFPFHQPEEPEDQSGQIDAQLNQSVKWHGHDIEHETTWGLGAFNPSGIAGKVPLLRNLSEGIYAISESHLTDRGLQRFALELRQHRSQFTFLGGAPAPYKKSGIKAVGGKHTGVGFLTTFPFRKITSGWQPELYSTGRLCCATFQVGSHFVAGAVIYGYAAHADTKEAIRHGKSIWSAVLRAPGFGKSFPEWWKFQAQTHPQWIPWCPNEPPDLAIARHFAEVMETMYRALESSMRAKSIEQARKRRMDDPNKIFQDLRKTPPVPVQMLLAKTIMTVKDVPDEGSVVVDNHTDIELAKPCETTHGPLSIVHAEEGQIWFAQEHKLAVGDTVTQTSMQGDISTLHDAFLQTWLQRWDAHRHLSDDHWNEVVEFIRLAMPTAPMTLQPLTVERWYKALKAKKSRSAKGMDSMTRSDLLAMPHAFHVQVVRLLNSLEAGGTWPSQWLDGAVHSLAKVESPEVVSHFRPITVMPIIYRTYTSLRARELLAHIASVAPYNMFGNRPKRTALSLWWSIQQRVELALYQDAPANGIISDIIKAFNCLPRLPVYAAAKAIGVPNALLHSWSLAATGIKRYFYIQGSPSAPALSCTGFVEGCGLSVCAMSLLNMVIHRFMELRHPTIQFLSYVDNYEIEAWSIHAAQQGLQSLDRFCRLLDVSLDHAKTLQWATAPGDRKALRQLNINPIRTCRDLGGQMSYTSCRNNSIVTSKLAKLDDTWHKLARSNAPLSRKFQILRIVTWPRALHAASTVHVGPAHFDHARAQAMQALGLAKMGANPQIQLALICHPLSDPEFYATWDSISQARRHAEHTIFNANIAYAAHMEVTKVKPGPAGVLYLRLLQLGWNFVGEGIFSNHRNNPMHLWDSPMPELKARITRSYVRYVGMLWSHRKDFQGLQAVHPGLSAIDRSLFSLDEVGMLRALQNGSMFTNDCLVHIDGPEGSQTDQCKFCGALDSLQHRHWECVHTKFSRSMIPSQVLEQIHALPDCARNRGWMTEPAEFSVFKDALYTIPANIHISPVHFPGRKLDLFTDGSGIDPAIPVARLVGWGVVIAGETTQHAASPYAWGGIHGEWQTVPRAETMGLLVALSAGQVWKGPFAIWSDNELVVNRARGLQAETVFVTSTMADHDLWQSIQDILATKLPCEFHLVRSHQDVTNAEEWEAWVFHMNDAADHLAQFAVESLPPPIHAKQQAAAAAFHRTKDLCRVLHQHFVRVASLSVTSQAITEGKDMNPVNDTVGLVHWAGVLRSCFNMPPNLQFAGVDKVLSWIAWFEDPQQPVVALSWYETLWSYQMHSQTWGVTSTSCHNTWKERSQLHEYDAISACREWRNYLTHLIKLADGAFVSRHHRPSNPRFQSWSMGIQCAVSIPAKSSLTTWLQEQCGDKQLTTVKHSIAQLPPAVSRVPVPARETKKFGLHRYLRPGERS
eukprot:s1144_g17.t1